MVLAGEHEAAGDTFQALFGSVDRDERDKKERKIVPPVDFAEVSQIPTARAMTALVGGTAPDDGAGTHDQKEEDTHFLS